MTDLTRSSVVRSTLYCSCVWPQLYPVNLRNRLSLAQLVWIGHPARRHGVLNLFFRLPF
jgi:hypothetical protein